MPDLYDYIPEDTRNMDVNMVERGDTLLYYWDSVPVWDAEPYTWDEVIGPEPIMKTTVRMWQMELEKTRDEIERLSYLFNLKDCPDDYLPYLASVYGVELPSATAARQREFLERLPSVLRRKGSPLSYEQLFEALGFEVFLYENYQRKADGYVMDGPQIDRVTTDIVQDEPLGTTSAAVTYTFTALNTPLQRGTIALKIFENSAVTPTIIRDDSDGGWGDDYAGTIDYFLGKFTITLPGAPALVGQPIQMDYRYFPDAFPDPFEVRWTDRFRSSIASVTIVPTDATVSITDELSDRLLLYRDLLTPAHVVFGDFNVLFEDEDAENTTLDEIFPVHSIMRVESEFGTMYHGHGYETTTVNGSLSPDPSYPASAGRDEAEYLRDPALLDTAEETCPYAYPVDRSGTMLNPRAANLYEWEWNYDGGVFSAAVTNDVAVPTTTNFSIAKGAGTTHGVGDFITFDDGPVAGECRQILLFVDSGTYYDVTTTATFSVPPVIGNTSAVLDADALDRDNLDTREEDPAEIVITDLMAVADGGPGAFTDNTAMVETHTEIPYRGDGATTVFNGVSLANTYIRPSTVTLSFWIDVLGTRTLFTETDDGVGGWTNVNGYIAAGTINYVNGAVAVTFTTAPDGAAGGIFNHGTTTITMDYTSVDEIYTAVGDRVVLSYTVGGNPFTETDDGAGNFTVAATHLTAGTIDYTTGAVSLTFGGGGGNPDNLTDINLIYNTVKNSSIGVI
jgi:hypothetical protein